MAKPIKAPLHVFDGRFYAKLGATCFVLGGCIETFMIKTGFYDKVTEIEAAKRVEAEETGTPAFGTRAGVDPWAGRK